MRHYTADFETTTNVDDCRVWAFALCDMDNIDNVVYGSSIEEFFMVIRKLPSCKIYFHNLGFDGSFIMDFMLRNHYEWTDERRPSFAKGFSTVISDMNQVYSICVNMGMGRYVTFWDSLKLIPLSIAAEAKAFGLEEGKGDLDYTAFREVGHTLTEEERDYIRRDVQIDALALRFMFDNGLNKMTIGACALADFKHGLGGDKGFRYHFPILTPEQDEFIRLSYKGGWCYANPKYAGSLLGCGISFDVNSLYPSVMASCDGEVLPYGQPHWFYGEPEPASPSRVWIAKVSCSFTSKAGHLPCVQMKRNVMFRPTEYITDSQGVQTLTVTSVDWELMSQQYDLDDVEWHGGYWFRASSEIFKPYVDKWVKMKNQATIDGNAGLRQIAKLMLNSLYGKFATQLVVRSRRPEIDPHRDYMHYVDIEDGERDGVYLPAGCFITAWARYKTVRAAQACGDRFIYSDTDSVKVLGTEPLDMDIDSVRLGAWKDEGHFSRFKVLRAKTYMADYGTEEEPNIEVHVAGLPARCHSQVTFDNFRLGATYQGKLYQVRTRGGIVLVEDSFTIKG